LRSDQQHKRSRFTCDEFAPSHDTELATGGCRLSLCKAEIFRIQGVPGGDMLAFEDAPDNKSVRADDIIVILPFSRSALSETGRSGRRRPSFHDPYLIEQP
jgi:hypothetical protein